MDFAFFFSGNIMFYKNGMHEVFMALKFFTMQCVADTEAARWWGERRGVGDRRVLL